MSTRPNSLWLRILKSSLLSCALLWVVASPGILGLSYRGPSQTNNDFLQMPEVDRQAQHSSQNRKTSPLIPDTLQALLGALEVMQDRYFEIFTGGWPTSIDWTAAVLGTHISATLSGLVISIEYSSAACTEVLAWENTVDRYFAHTSVFYFGQNDFALRNEAYDDMLWVVLGWLENIKFMNVRSNTYWGPSTSGVSPIAWHGLQFRASAAHRARIFYDLASHGWDTSLCNGGMVWNPALTPYKNAITNELFISASVAMYLYFPGDVNESPYLTSPQHSREAHPPHNPRHLLAAIKAYQWLEESQMRNDNGLFADGYHIRGWRKYANGTIDPGTGKCDELNEMVYTYNQGVILSADRGLWIATGDQNYLERGHELVENVIKASGWYRRDGNYHGMGRDGVLEEYCDHAGQCSQDGQTFKGIFFHHLAEFCRPLWPMEKEFMMTNVGGGVNESVYKYHQLRCAAYGPWISHNAQAALETRDKQGRFGMWWGRTYPDTASQAISERSLGAKEVDYRNTGILAAVNGTWVAGEDEGSRKQATIVVQEIKDVNDRGRGRTVETQSGGLAVLRALWQWESLEKQ